jgi:hypothetical protein
MKRTQIQFDDKTYDTLRRRAYEEGRSMSSIVRETLARAFGEEDLSPRQGVGEFTFVGVGRAKTRTERPVSEQHDEALAAAYGGTDR